MIKKTFSRKFTTTQLLPHSIRDAHGTKDKINLETMEGTEGSKT